jgi:hypothetical protein
MKIFRFSLTALLLLSITSNYVYSENRSNNNKKSNPERLSTVTIDENERLHLIFMREEEKLARDVYLKLSKEYPDTTVFGKKALSETRHSDSVLDALVRFEIDDPVTNDNIGVFSGKEFGAYFTEKYSYLITQGLSSELDGLYVGAYIEELDILDIRTCPTVMIETIGSIESSKDCGLLYSNNRVISSLYDHLITGSESHLKAFVVNIEKSIGEGAYRAQVLPQQVVDDILGR